MSPNAWHYTVSVDDDPEATTHDPAHLTVKFQPRYETLSEHQAAEAEEAHVVVNRQSFRIVEWHFTAD
ncbi:MAG TPA: hypothetical protein VGF28_15170 [Thermoanaerobaculia bacterium]